MNSKNSSNHHESNKNPRVGFWTTTVTIASLVSGIFISSPVDSKPTDKDIADFQKKNTLEVVDHKDNLEYDTLEPSHEIIAKMNFDDIIASYGNEKGMQIIRNHFLIEINNKRIALGNTSLKLHTVINELAQAQAQKMADDENFSHIDKDGNSASDRMIADGRYDFETYASNISYNITTISGIVQSYINNNKRKTGHYDVISVKEYADLGAGIAKGKNGIWYAVVNYGKELPKK